MQIRDAENGTKFDIIIEGVNTEDFKSITKAKFFFNWKTEKKNALYKLRLKDSEEILGLISLIHFKEEQRFEIKLLAVSKENRGKHKKFEGIAGNLIAFACREALKEHGENGCVSLQPKTELKTHYITQYKMLDAGWQVFLEGENLLNFYAATLNNYGKFKKKIY